MPQLDQVVPQINVQVRIQELTDSATRSLGLNANLNFGGFSIGTSSGNGLAATFDTGTAGTTGADGSTTLAAHQNDNLTALLGVVLGGTSLFGGRGSVLGTLVGALIVGVLRNGLTLVGIDNLYQNIATGVLVIAAGYYFVMHGRRHGRRGTVARA